ncbi:ARMT1-like domain-containing protein [uncultured Desulfobacter sp.]|uniref:ARMT1-like domain-containing protein n=1 Tax=uncultured Desulfobacter sp. TaxID=240139 RepID=UPI002AAB8D42|nr:ARMT1-like domain-containing protein [uncultured Desulfobacter sp.]
MASIETQPKPLNADPDQYAWFTAFFLENHIDPFAYPMKVGSREQVEFMVYSENGELFYPCSDTMFSSIMSRNRPRFLCNRYREVLDKILAIVDEFIESEYDRAFLSSLIRIKYDNEIQSRLLIPSRLEKRLYMIFLSRTHIEDPYDSLKKKENTRAYRFMVSETFKKALYEVNGSIDLKGLSLRQIKEKINEIEFTRRLCLLTATCLWQDDNFRVPSSSAIKAMFKTKMTGNGVEQLLELVNTPKSKILWLTDESGDVVADIAIAQFLANIGHVVILAVKEGPFFKKVCLTDTRTDPILAKLLEQAHFIHDKAISKNKLVQRLKQDENLYVISDGTQEALNLLLVSTTFSRVFKEVDCVVSRGQKQRNRLILTHFRFTRDVINICAKDNMLDIVYKPRHPDFINFSHTDLEEKADKIISKMRQAKEKNMTVMFYSGIIGSIPGKIDVAIKIMSCFIEHLKSQSDNLFIINPSLYYEPGMDADDLMYMWEIVQRSGYIDIWRFQTYEDIAQSFAIMEQKVPPEWIGKDATYSTGCTKEMRIAQDVQKTNPEMQLMGPSVDKFMRRDEYGVGSMYDQRLAGL